MLFASIPLDISVSTPQIQPQLYIITHILHSDTDHVLMATFKINLGSQLPPGIRLSTYSEHVIHLDRTNFIFYLKTSHLIVSSSDVPSVSFHPPSIIVH